MSKFSIPDAFKHAKIAESEVVRTVLDHSLTLSTGLRIGHISPKQLKLSTGDILTALPTDIASKFVTDIFFYAPKAILFNATSEIYREIHKYSEVHSQLSDEVLEYLYVASFMLDALLVPLPIIHVLQAMSIRDDFPRIFSYKATKATEKLSAEQRVADVTMFIY